MKSPRILRWKSLSFLLVVSLLLPHPAYALRVRNFGPEEPTPVLADLQAGLEGSRRDFFQAGCWALAGMLLGCSSKQRVPVPEPPVPGPAGRPVPPVVPLPAARPLTAAQKTFAQLDAHLGPKGLLITVAWDKRGEVFPKDFFERAVALSKKKGIFLSGGFGKLPRAQRQAIVDQADAAGVLLLGLMYGEPDWVLREKTGAARAKLEEFSAALSDLDLKNKRIKFVFVTDVEPHGDKQASGWNGDLAGHVALHQEVFLPEMARSAAALKKRFGRDVIWDPQVVAFVPHWWENGHKTDDGLTIRNGKSLPMGYLIMTYQPTAGRILDVSRQMYPALDVEGATIGMGVETKAGIPHTFGGREKQIPDTLLAVHQGLPFKAKSNLFGLFIHTGSLGEAYRLWGALLDEQSPAAPEQKPEPALNGKIEVIGGKATEFTGTEITMRLRLPAGMRASDVVVFGTRVTDTHYLQKGDGDADFFQPVGADGSVTVRAPAARPFVGSGSRGRALIVVRKADAEKFIVANQEGRNPGPSTAAGKYALAIIEVSENGTARVVDSLPRARAGAEEEKVEALRKAVRKELSLSAIGSKLTHQQLERLLEVDGLTPEDVAKILRSVGLKRGNAAQLAQLTARVKSGPFLSYLQTSFQPALEKWLKQISSGGFVQKEELRARVLLLKDFNPAETFGWLESLPDELYSPGLTRALRRINKGLLMKKGYLLDVFEQRCHLYSFDPNEKEVFQGRSGPLIIFPNARSISQRNPVQGGEIYPYAFLVSNVLNVFPQELRRQLDEAALLQQTISRPSLQLLLGALKRYLSGRSDADIARAHLLDVLAHEKCHLLDDDSYVYFLGLEDADDIADPAYASRALDLKLNPDLENPLQVFRPQNPLIVYQASRDLASNVSTWIERPESELEFLVELLEYYTIYQWDDRALISSHLVEWIEAQVFFTLSRQVLFPGRDVVSSEEAIQRLTSLTPEGRKHLGKEFHRRLFRFPELAETSAAGAEEGAKKDSLVNRLVTEIGPETLGLLAAAAEGGVAPLHEDFRGNPGVDALAGPKRELWAISGAPLDSADVGDLATIPVFIQPEYRTQIEARLERGIRQGRIRLADSVLERGAVVIGDKDYRESLGEDNIYILGQLYVDILPGTATQVDDNLVIRLVLKMMKNLGRVSGEVVFVRGQFQLGLEAEKTTLVAA